MIKTHLKTKGVSSNVAIAKSIIQKKEQELENARTLKRLGQELKYLKEADPWHHNIVKAELDRVLAYHQYGSDAYIVSELINDLPNDYMPSAAAEAQYRKKMHSQAIMGSELRRSRS